MASIPETVSRVSQFDIDGRRRAAALLIIRYCGFHSDPKFLPWFENAQAVLSDCVQAALWITQENSLPSSFDALREAVAAALDERDPDGPPFEIEIADHLNFASEVLDYLAEPEDLDLLASAYERADELSEAHQEMSEEGEQGSMELHSLESETRGADAFANETPIESVTRSQIFARSYAEVIGNYYSDEDAGIR